MPENPQPYQPIGDPLIDEVRAIRHQIWEECGHDMKKHLEQLRAIEAQFPNRIVTKEELMARRARAKESTR